MAQANAPEASASRPLKMRDLERLTGVHRETIRVYFRAGLLPEPKRPKPNVAHYSESHVRAIVAIRHLNRHGRISLKQIARGMDGDASIVPRDAASRAHVATLMADRVANDEELVPLAQVEERTPGAARDAKAFVKVGAVTLVDRQGGPYVSRADARILEIWVQMRDAGFTEDNGFDPEDTFMYVAAAKSLAHAEVKRFLSTGGAPANDARTADMAFDGLQLMLEFFSILRQRAVVEEMRRQTGS